MLQTAEPLSEDESFEPPPSQHGLLHGSVQVLYAEDDAVNVELIRGLLAFRPAIALRVAESGKAALAMARCAPPDLILVDMNLGDMTGIQLASALRQDPATRSVPLVGLSADALPEHIDAALSAGFHSYVTKPIEFRKLLDVLDECLVVSGEGSRIGGVGGSGAPRGALVGGSTITSELSDGGAVGDAKDEDGRLHQGVQEPADQHRVHVRRDLSVGSGRRARE